MSGPPSTDREMALGPKGGAHLALGVFVVYLALAWVVLVFDLGSGLWFLRDDWKFLAGRDGGSLTDIFRPHDVHPAAIPVVVFRLMFNAFGLWFTPYLMLIVTLHLGVAAMLRVVMRRAGVGPWIASAAAGALVLFGPGEENIHWAFQINFVGSMLLGLTQLVLADHDGPVRRRDVVGAVAGVAAVMCSGIGPLMLVAVGLATLARRGWKIAALHTAPAALTYVTWVLFANPAEYPFGRPGLPIVWDWVREGQVATIEALGHYPLVGVLLAALLVGGLGLAAASTPLDELRRRATVPVALLLCGPLLFVLASQGRWVAGLGLARSSRYLYIGAVCMLPALALAGDAVARRWRDATPAVVALLLVGIPGNIDVFGDGVFLNERYFERHRQVLLGAPRTSEAEQVAPWVRPLPDQFNGEDLTIGWLLDLREEGRLPSLDHTNPRIASTFPIVLGLGQVATPFSEGCETHTTALALTVEPGDRLGFRAGMNAAVVHNGNRASPWTSFHAGSGQTLVVQLPMQIRLAPVPNAKTFTVCR